jgi:hypothetical protein
MDVATGGGPTRRSAIALRFCTMARRRDLRAPEMGAAGSGMALSCSGTSAPRSRECACAAYNTSRQLRWPYTLSPFMAISEILAGSLSVAPTSMILRASI